MRVQPENKKTVPRGSQSSYKENMLERKGACHGAILTVASTVDHWQSSLSGNAWLDYGMFAVLPRDPPSFKFLPHLCLNSSPCDSTLSRSSQ